MSIAYNTKKEFSSQELEALFLSVEWSSGHFPDKLVAAMRNFSTVRLGQRGQWGRFLLSFEKESLWVLGATRRGCVFISDGVIVSRS